MTSIWFKVEVSSSMLLGLYAATSIYFVYGHDICQGHVFVTHRGINIYPIAWIIFIPLLFVNQTPYIFPTFVGQAYLAMVVYAPAWWNQPDTNWGLTACRYGWSQCYAGRYYSTALWTIWWVTVGLDFKVLHKCKWNKNGYVPRPNLNSLLISIHGKMTVKHTLLDVVIWHKSTTWERKEYYIAMQN